MGSVNRDLFLKKAERRYKAFDIPGFGNVRIQSLTEGEKSDYELEIVAKKGGLNQSKLRAGKRRLIVLCVVDDAGNRVLRDGDEAQLEQMDGAVSQKIYDEARAHCGFDEGDLEELVKNSGSVHVEDSQ